MVRKAIKKMAGKVARRTTAKKAPAAKASAKVASKRLNINDEQLFQMIQQRAYDIYCKRDMWAGDQHGDWIVAEQQIRYELGLR